MGTVLIVICVAVLAAYAGYKQAEYWQGHKVRDKYLDLSATAHEVLSKNPSYLLNDAEYIDINDAILRADEAIRKLRRIDTRREEMSEEAENLMREASAMIERKIAAKGL